jgi:2',5'-phosphodiesterase
MKSRGYNCKLRMKNNNSKEGVAILLKKERFEVERWIDFTLNSRELRNILGIKEQNQEATTTSTVESTTNNNDTVTLSAEEQLEREKLKQVLDDPQFEEAMNEVPSVGLIAVVRDKAFPNRKLIVGNTHLYYHGEACHIRILQTYMFTRRMEKIRQEELAKSGAIVVGQVLLGDFNFTRNTGSYALVAKGEVDESHRSWGLSKKYYWGMDDDNANGEAEIEKEKQQQQQQSQQINNINNDNDDGDVAAAAEEEGEVESDATTSSTTAAEGKSTTKQQQNQGQESTTTPKKTYKGPSEKGVALKLQLAQKSPFIDCFANDKTLECTNYSLWFKAIIDHVFVDSNSGYFDGTNTETVVKQTLAAPSMDQLAEHIAIPSHIYPSDHIALVCDVCVKKQ